MGGGNRAAEFTVVVIAAWFSRENLHEGKGGSIGMPGA